MRAWLLFTVVLGLACGQAPASPEASSSAGEACILFLLKEEAGDLSIERLVLGEGEVQVVQIDSTSEAITLLTPVSVGRSGEVVQRSANRYLVVSRCQHGTVRTTVRVNAGEERTLPPTVDWTQHDVRVNVTGGEGMQRVFRMRGGAPAEIADGPVLDLFGGQLPLQPRDYAITTEVTAREVQRNVQGSAPLHFDGRHLFVQARLEHGVDGWMVVDFAASGTVVSRSALAPDAPVDPLVMVEHSAAGTRQGEGSIDGAGGRVESFLGQSVLPRLTVGEVVFENVRVGVLDTMPDVGGRQPIGILGLDVLRRADRVAFDITTGDVGRLVWGSAPPPSDAASVPFSVAYDHLFLPGRVGTIPVSFLFDTGSWISFITPGLAESAHLRILRDTSVEIRGLDGVPATVRPTEGVEIHLGEVTFPNTTLHVGDPGVLQRYGLGEDGGLLGNDVWQRFGTVWVDFADRHIYLPIALDE